MREVEKGRERLGIRKSKREGIREKERERERERQREREREAKREREMREREREREMGGRWVKFIRPPL